jgi:thioredoxin-related protein
MKTRILRIPSLFVAILLLGCLGARADETQWLTDYNAALQQAKSAKRNVLLDFTGSDWCEACIKMEKEVLNTPEFKDYASKHLILMQADFPIRKPLPQKLADQNSKLQDEYGVDGMPAYILVDKNGNVLGRQVGYLEGGPSAFIAKIESMKK